MKKAKNNQPENEATELRDQEMEATAETTTGETAESSGTEDKVAELNDKYLRLYSEFDNYRRRTARERLDLMKSAAADLLSELLPVADDFDRTVSSIETSEKKEIDALLEGVKLVQHKFINTLQKQGLTAFDAMEQPFDPDVHEAITKIPAPTPELKGKVVDVIEKGYMLNDRVLRYAKVVVGE
ncbi:MAG: nucleotide exchange factor GrpE [Flavobacteriales bacterium]|nr:nucleotide exchange factor GrpE [Bacteroidota bacterium]MCB9240236.1 nucleotide exchange factor GrpE [Flavobacteriales bacterium]